MLGIDIGGSGIKAAPVDVATGRLLAERRRIETPQPATPPAVTEVVAALVDAFAWTGPVGATFPAVIRAGRVETAANVDEAWIGTAITELFGAAIGRPVTVVNDADAAGVAEMRFGAGLGRPGVVIMVTLGTGIGSALFVDGRLVPNTELGHLELDGHDAEQRASAAVREAKGLSWEKWGRRVSRYLKHLERLFWPDLLIVGGGVSKRFDRFAPYLDTRTEVVPAKAGNDAGIAGAALVAADASWRVSSGAAPPP